MIDAILTTMAWIFGVIISGAIAYLTWDELQYKHKAAIINKTGSNRQYKVVRVKEVIDKDGSYWWKIKKVKDLVSRPPNDYIDITDKGKSFATFYQLNGGELHPVKLCDITMNEENKDFVAKVKPLTTSQRQMLVNQQLKIQRQKKKSMAEILQYAIPFMALVVIIAIVMIFADEAFQPMIELGKTNEQVTDKLIIVADKLDQVINNRVSVTNYETTRGVYDNTPPPIPN